MAVMKTCCCCGVRSGSIASAVYSLVLAIIGLVYFGYSAAAYTISKAELARNGISVGGTVAALYALNIIACIVFVFLIIACIFVFVGVSQDNKGMLIPFMVAQGLHLLWYIIIFVVVAIILAQVGDIWAYGYTYLFLIVVLIPFFIGDLVCLLCVNSQYQELRDGRGRVTDQPGTTHTTVVVQQQAPANVVYASNPPAYKS